MRQLSRSIGEEDRELGRGVGSLEQCSLDRRNRLCQPVSVGRTGAKLAVLSLERHGSKLGLLDSRPRGVRNLLPLRRRGRRRELDNRIGVESNVSLTGEGDECLRRAARIRELGIDADCGGLILLCELRECHTVKRELSDHAYAVELLRDEVEEFVVVEGSETLAGGEVSIGGGDERRAFLADHAADAGKYFRGLGETAQVGNDDEVDVADLGTHPRKPPNGNPARSPLGFVPGPRTVGIPNLDCASTQPNEQGSQPE